MITIGFFSAGLDTYWNQFQGLLDNLSSYGSTLVDKIRQEGVQVCDIGMVDSPAKAREGAARMRAAGVDLIFAHIATYCLSSTILPIAQETGCPMILLNIQPLSAIEYGKINALGDRGKMTGMWLESCTACSIPEIAGVFNNAGIRYDIISGYLDDPVAIREIAAWVEAAKAWKALRNSRLGLLGHYYCGMVDVYTDLRYNADEWE